MYLGWYLGTPKYCISPHCSDTYVNVHTYFMCYSQWFPVSFLPYRIAGWQLSPLTSLQPPPPLPLERHGRTPPLTRALRIPLQCHKTLQTLPSSLKVHIVCVYICAYVSWCRDESWVDQRVPQDYIHNVIPWYSGVAQVKQGPCQSPAQPKSICNWHILHLFCFTMAHNRCVLPWCDLFQLVSTSWQL